MDLYNTFAPFYSPWESVSVDERQQKIAGWLSEYIEFSKLSAPFYRERLQGFSWSRENAMAKIPLLTPDDLRTQLPPSSRALLTTENDSYTVFQSGGTTGVPKVSLFSYDEMELINDCNARGFFSVGLKATDRVANLWSVGGLHMTFVHMNRVLQQYGCMSFPFSNQTPSDYVEQVARQFQINCFTGPTSVVLTCLRAMYKNQVNFPKQSFPVNKVYFGGEHIYDADIRELMEDMGIGVIAAPCYGTIDSWYIGYQCGYTPNGIFHAFDDHVFIEIIDEITGEVCSNDSPGLLVVTTFRRKLTPMIRYRVGDRARWLKTPCSCGRTTPLFQLLGRGDDILRIGYDSVDYAAIQKVIAPFKELTGAVQMEKIRRGGKDGLVVRIETSLEPNFYDEISSRLEQAILHDRSTLRDVINKQLVWPIHIEFVKQNSLPRNARTGKLIRVIDAL